jgi:hypothetical protein
VALVRTSSSSTREANILKIKNAWLRSEDDEADTGNAMTTARVLSASTVNMRFQIRPDSDSSGNSSQHYPNNDSPSTNSISRSSSPATASHDVLHNLLRPLGVNTARSQHHGLRTTRAQKRWRLLASYSA